MSITRATHPTRKATGSRVGLALAGGGPLGGTYQIGALLALEEAVEGIDFHNLDVYVGVSAGAFLAANLANQFSIAQIARIYISNESRHHPISPWVFMTPAYREYMRRVAMIPRAMFDAWKDFVLNPFDAGLFGGVSYAGRVIPAGVFDNEPLNRFLADLYQTRGATNDFRELKQKLFIVAADLDTGESIKFGSEGYDHVPISKAVQASTALPGLYPPVCIDDRHFVDGALKRTLHASVALEAGADLLLCINPIVPFDANLAVNDRRKKHDKLVEGGLPLVLSQTFRALIHSRMAVGMNAYNSYYDDKDVVLFEPDREDSRMFFANVFSYSSRRKVCEHGYTTTRRDLLSRMQVIGPVFERHGLKLRPGVLRDSKRTFKKALARSRDEIDLGEYKNAVTNQLHNNLEQLGRWMGGS